MFVCCSEEATTEYRSARVSCIISSTGEENEKPPLVIHGLSLFFRDKGHYSLDAYGVDELCYLITTSGTLGQRKEVLVPYSCIMPNIQDFRSACFLKYRYFLAPLHIYSICIFLTHVTYYCCLLSLILFICLFSSGSLFIKYELKSVF